ncbi:type VI secretion system tip protein VgrG [Enterobacter sp.]|uniref:type VI secretion system Vgr family protein n=1 Tax=Enterobacter sp. TaxID=42895 RepID=UPI00296F5158|nr:type VI secretion system tip protein TssI/VgrG [Enterobacter sp.]
MSQTGLRFTLEVEGLPPEALTVVSFHLTQALSELFSLEVSLVSQTPDITFSQVLEKTAHLTIRQDGEIKRRVRGVVTWFESGENDGHRTLYSMRVRPPLWRAALRQNFCIFQNQDIKDILATLLQENDVTAWSPLLSEPRPAREFCVQYGETDYDFLCRLAAEEGIFFYEEHALHSTDQSLVLCDTVRFLPAPFDLPWNPNVRTEVSTPCISRFRHSAQIRPSQVISKDYTFKRPGWAGRFEHEGENLDYQRTQYEVFDYPGRFKHEHGRNFARWQAEGWRNNAETAHGRSRSPEIWPGRRIRLTGHPQAGLNREWQVTESELSGSQPQALPGRRGAGTTLENHFIVVPADRTWRPQPLPKPRVDGPQSAVVTGPEGEEIFCDEHGRVRVKFHWDRYNPADQNSSCWIRVAQAWAGAGFGNLAIPRVGQEVIVDFLNGDPDQPLITGRTYHEENRAPGSLPGTKTQMTIRSKTYRGSGFNELRFDDATGNEQVYLHAQKNMDTEVLNNRTTDVKVNHSETIGNSQRITVGTGQTVSVGSQKAGGHDQRITVANDRTLRVGNDRRTDVGQDEGLYAGRDRTVTVKGKQAHTTAGDHVSLVEGTHSLTVKGDLARKVSGALGIKVQGDIVLESSGSITLKAGGSFVVIRPGGVDICGPAINLNGGGSPGTPVGVLRPKGLLAQTDVSSLFGQINSNDQSITETLENNNNADNPPEDKKNIDNQDIITTETKAVMPDDRARTKIGVGEQVNITCNNAVYSWAISPDDSGTIVKTSSNTASFTASDRAVISTVTVTTANGKNDVQFTIVEPSAFVMDRVSGTPLIHNYGVPDCGWLGRPYVEPSDVNFYAIFIRERDSQATGTGPYSHLTGRWHGRYVNGVSNWFQIDENEYSPCRGSSVDPMVKDTIFATVRNRAGTTPPFSSGVLYMPIIWEWTIDKDKVYSFPETEQKHEIFKNGRCTTTKTNHNETTLYSDPDSGLNLIHR